MKTRKTVAKRILPVLFVLTTLTYGFAQQSVEENYHNARDHLIEERYDRALEAFRSIVNKNPESDRADDAQYYIGYTLEEMGRYQEAETYLARAAEALPGHAGAERNLRAIREYLQQVGSATGRAR